MATYTYEVKGFYWSGVGVENYFKPVVITDDDELMSSAEVADYTETITIDGDTYNNPIGGTYALGFINSEGAEVVEPFLLMGFADNVFIVVPIPGSEFKDGTAFTKVGGWHNVLGDRWDEVTCFCAGTNIQTIGGARKVESIRIGDLVKTKAGFSEVRWIGKRTIEMEFLRANPKLFPVRIKAGALGSGMPKQDLLVSRQHRMMVYSNVARRMFGDAEALVSAIRLTDLPGIYVDEYVESVEYFHLLFDQHEIIYAEGAPSESLYLGAETIKTMSQEALEEILTIFPELANINFKALSACHIPPGRLQKKLVSRHAKNGKLLLY